MARPFVQDIPQHIGKNPYRTHGEWVKRSNRAAYGFLLLRGQHLRAEIAHRIKDGKVTPTRDAAGRLADSNTSALVCAQGPFHVIDC
jgi:hypothetical protein